MQRPTNALDLLRQDHQHVHALLQRFEQAQNEDEQRELCGQIVGELKEHTEIEERVFYPYLRDATGREDLFEEASIEHQTAKNLMNQLEREQPGTPRMEAMVKVLGEYVEHHVREEEGEIFPQIEQSGVDLEALGQTLEECRSGEPAGQPDGGDAREPQAAKPAPARAGKADNDDARFLKKFGHKLSRSTQRAKWISSFDDKPERDGQTLATRNMDVIRGWATARNATPATSPGGDTERPRVLRFDFPGFDKNLQPVSWEAWQRSFEERNLVFVFQDTMKAGNQSNFFIFDNPDREDG
jgi:hemerythrin superfamily protein